MSSSSATQQTDDKGPYADLCRAMKEGMLITVNNSLDGRPVGSEELEVIGVDEETADVRVKGYGGSYYLITNTDPEHGTAIKEVSESEFTQTHDPVISIEVIGFAE